MSDDTTIDGLEFRDTTEGGMTVTYTQVASCACGNDPQERRRQSLRARLERETYERQKQLENTFMGTFRNLFGNTKH
jgi:hypothetical protein